MMRTILKKIIVLAVIVSFMATPFTGVNASAAKSKVKLSLTGKCKLLGDSSRSGSYVGDRKFTYKKGKDGIYTLTMYSGQYVGIKVAKTKGYWVEATNGNRKVDGLKYNYGEVSTTNANYVVIRGYCTDDEKTYKKVLKLRSYKRVGKGKCREAKPFGPTVKIRVVVKPNVAKGTYNEKAVKEFIKAINKARVAEGLDEVVITPAAQAFAETRAKELQEFKFAHERPNGLEWEFSGECIQFGGSDGYDIWDGFENSPQHKNLLTLPNMTDFGVGIYEYGKQQYVSVNFRSYTEDEPGDPGYTPETSWEEEDARWDTLEGYE